jgi:glycine dehydrogenase subunit 1
VRARLHDPSGIARRGGADAAREAQSRDGRYGSGTAVTAVTAAERLAKIPGVKVVNNSFFNEFALRLPKPAAQVVEPLAQRGILAGVPVSRLCPGRGELADLLLVAATETVTADDIERLAAGLTEVLR